jgi:hypothetical protein
METLAGVPVLHGARYCVTKLKQWTQWQSGTRLVTFPCCGYRVSALRRGVYGCVTRPLYMWTFGRNRPCCTCLPDYTALHSRGPYLIIIWDIIFFVDSISSAPAVSLSNLIFKSFCFSYWIGLLQQVLNYLNNIYRQGMYGFFAAKYLATETAYVQFFFSENYSQK